MAKPLFESEDLGLVVFSPDAVRSQLVNSLEREISSLTGCVPVSRQWFQHTPASIEAFYQASIPNNTPHWHLVSELFNSGSSLAVVWQGENTLSKLDSVKGSSHPAEAKSQSIRSRYWCDNAVMNLIHVSDNLEAATHEIGIIQSCAGGFEITNQVLQCLPQDDAITVSQVEHSGILVFLRMVQRLVESYSNIRLGKIDCSGNSSAKLSQSLAQTKLEQYADTYPSISPCIQQFLAGDPDTASHLNSLIPLSQWERLVISCGVASRKQWNRLPLDEALESICSKLPLDCSWIVSGSAALAIQGFKCKPNDIDIWCSQDAIHIISDLLGIDKEAYSVAGLKGEVIKWHHCGWEVEIVGPLSTPEGQIISVDNQMLDRASISQKTESIEDLVAELLLLRRPAPKDDLKRALGVLSTYRNKVDHDYLSWRLCKWNIPEKLIELL